MTPNPVVQETRTNPLTADEQAILAELQRLFDTGCEEVPDELIARIRSTIHWRRDDPVSVERALYFAEHDPFLKRESDLITEEFAFTARDELADYPWGDAT